MRSNIVAAAIFVCGILAFALAPPGCQDGKVTEEQKSFLQNQIDTTKTTLAEQRAKEEAKLAAPTTSVEDKAAAQKQLDRIAALEKKTADAEALLAKMVKPDGTIDYGAGAAAVGAALPPPWNLITLIGLPILVGGIQELRRKQAMGAATSLINQVDSAMIEVPAIREGFKSLAGETKEKVRGQLTPLAKKLIDQHSLT